MKNLTVSLDDVTYRRARVAAAEEGRSVTSVVREFLQGYAAEPSSHKKWADELERMFEELDAGPVRGGAGDRLSREEMYDEIMAERRSR